MNYKKQELPEATSIYFKNLNYIFQAFRFCILLTFKLRHDLFYKLFLPPANGPYSQRVITTLWVAFVIIVLIEIFYFLFCWGAFTERWAFTSWNRNRVPFIKFDREAVTIMGKTRIPWSGIEYVQDVESLTEPKSVFLIFALSEQLQHNRAAIPFLLRMTRWNTEVVGRYRSHFKIELNKDEFVSVRLPYDSGLTVHTENISALAQRYWRSAESPVHVIEEPQEFQ